MSVGNSIQAACKLVGLAKSTWYYRPKEQKQNSVISERLQELAARRPRFGSPRLTILIRNEFGAVNHKRVERLYTDAGLNLPRKRRKRKWQGRQLEMPKPEAPDHRWSMDFVHDRTADGRRFRVFNVVNDCTREAVICLPERSFSGHRIISELEQIFEIREKNLLVLLWTMVLNLPAVPSLDGHRSMKSSWISFNPGNQYKMLLLKVLTAGSETSA